MAENRGKQFEGIIREAFESVPDISVDRLHDQTNGFKGSQNICDFIIYKKPNILYLECKSCHGNTFPLSNITDTQGNGLLKKSFTPGVFAGVIVWWIDKDVTEFFTIDYIQVLKAAGYKSIHFSSEAGVILKGKKKRVFFDYDMKQFWEDLKCHYRQE